MESEYKNYLLDKNNDAFQFNNSCYLDISNLTPANCNNNQHNLDTYFIINITFFKTFTI